RIGAEAIAVRFAADALIEIKALGAAVGHHELQAPDLGIPIVDAPAGRGGRHAIEGRFGEVEAVAGGGRDESSVLHAVLRAVLPNARASQNNLLVVLVWRSYAGATLPVNFGPL